MLFKTQANGDIIAEFSGYWGIDPVARLPRRLDGLYWLLEHKLNFPDFIDPQNKRSPVEVIVTLEEYKQIGALWYCRYLLEFPPGFMDDARAFYADDYLNGLFSETIKNLMNNHLNDTPEMAKKTIISLERQVESLLAAYEEAHKAKQAASTALSLATTELEMFCVQNREKINPRDEGMRYLPLGAEEGKDYLLSFHKHTTPKFTAAFDLVKAVRRFPQIFVIKAAQGKITIDVEGVKALMKDNITKKTMEKLGIETETQEVFYVGQ